MDAQPSLSEKVFFLDTLCKTLKEKNSIQEKLFILNELDDIKSFLSQKGPVQTFLSSLQSEGQYVLKSIIAIGEAPIVFNTKNISEDDANQKILNVLEQLLELESFFSSIGGVIGYYLTVLKLIQDTQGKFSSQETHYIHPEGENVNCGTQKMRQTIRSGIESIEKIAMIYPLGGAGERLNLKDEADGHPLPVALLHFLGKTLLEGLIRDTQAYEYLFFKLTGKQCVIPIAMMTSTEKNNHYHILNICKKASWFQRSSDSFHFFIQPLVPVITCEGHWSLSSPLTLNLKPGGHGVMWKLAEETGTFHWMESLGKSQCIIRQINNPLAATDQALLALIGKGCAENKAFGFLSCERLLNSEEGTDILIEKETLDGYEYCLTNVEYPDFAKKGIGEIPSHPGSCYSTYPTNTNILFANIPSIKEALKKCFIPGQLINMKSKVPYLDPEGRLLQVSGGRLESTMQNIADSIVDRFPKKLSKEEIKEMLSSFIVYNTRSKTISSTKKCYQPGASLSSTPEQALYDMLKNHYDLLNQCGFELPGWTTIEKFIQHGPQCIFIFHPALGPLYAIISQKLRKGSFAKNAELQLEIAEVDIENLSLDGSLLIQPVSPLGNKDANGMLKYGEEPKCILKNVTVKNKGINRTVSNQYWKNEIQRHEKVEFVLYEYSEIDVQDIQFEGTHRYIVPAKHRLMLRPGKDKKIQQELRPIDKPTWKWNYHFDVNHRVQLTRSF